MDIGILKKVLKRLAQLYGLFAISHVVYKIYLLLRLIKFTKKHWKQLPGRDCDISGKAILKKADNFHDFFKDFSLEHPDSDFVKLDLPFPCLLANTPKSVKWILKDEFNNITKVREKDDYMIELLSKFLGPNGIFVLRHGNSAPEESKLWHKERKIASLIFTKSNFQSLFYDTFVEKAEAVNRRLENIKTGEAVDMQEIFFSFTMDSIEKFFMGTEVNTIEGGQSEYAKAFDKAHQMMMKLTVGSVAFQIAAGLLLPYPIGVSLNSKFGDCLIGKIFHFFSEDYSDFKEAVLKLDKHVLKYVRETRKDPNLKQRKDIIANFLNSKLGSDLNDQTLRDIVLNLTIAGRDTTACALSWMFFELTQNPEVQEKLIEEIDTKLQGRIPTLADLETESMPYLNGVVYETLRLHPPVPTDSKYVTKEVTFEDGTMVPENMVIYYSPYGMGRKSEVYKDPLKFDPTRWIPFEQPSLYEFPVFQAGPRFCLGKDMAQFEMKLLTTMLLQKYTFSLAKGEREKIHYSLMLTMSISNHPKRESYNLWCHPKKRA